MRLNHRRLYAVLALNVVLAAVVSATDFFETEGNDSKATANFFTLASGDRIIGNSISAATTGLDYFLVRTTAAVPGIYLNQMVLSTTGTVGHTSTLRGLNQTGTAATWAAGNVVPGTGGTIGTTDTTLQSNLTTVTNARLTQWYTFGAAADIYYRVAGTATTTSDYTATYSSSSVSATNIGTFQPGSINITTINQGHTTDTDLWVYDSNFNPIAGYGNDDTFDSLGVAINRSNLTRTYAAGTYYLALSTFNLANNQASPTDERFPTAAVTDFGGVVLNTSTTLNANISFAVTDSSGIPLQVAATHAAAFDVNFYSFTVVPEPASMAALGLGTLALLRRFRKKA
jgi:hypothetical protein